ncbi:MAG: HAMP domain-containing histidine kinase [Verrucomicrobiaceae bacterium]|nr:HAMP domain-containing histidine kinase [Verrucomicrobiaceae bacterium]
MLPLRSLTTRTLVKLGSGVGLLLVVMTAISHFLVFREVEQREVQHLGHFLRERVERLEKELAQVPGNLHLMREAFLRAWDDADTPDELESWSDDMVLYPDGAWRARHPAKEAPYDRLVLWIKKGVVVDDKLKRKLVALGAMCRKFQPGWAHGFRSCYGNNFDGSTITGFDAEMAGFDLPADFETTKDPTVVGCIKENNPERQIVWTSAHSVGPEYCMVSVVMPVDIDGEHLVNLGHDLLVNNLVTETERAADLGMKHVIFRDDGLLIANPKQTKEIHAANGKLTMLTSGDVGWATLFPAIKDRKEADFTGYDAASGLYYAGHRLKGPNWIYLAAIPRAILHAQAFTTTRWVLWTAIPAFVLGLMMLGQIMSRNIAKPIDQLVSATRALASGGSRVHLPKDREDELGILAQAFDQMVHQVTDEKANLERRVAERTVELEAALAQQTELTRMKSDFVSLVSHEFRTPLGVIMSSSDVLRRYQDRLSAEQRGEQIGMIVENTRNLAGMVDEVLMLGRVEDGRVAFSPRHHDIGSLITKLVQEANAAAQARVHVALECESDLPLALTDEGVVRHILANLLSNAVKYSSDHSEITVRAYREGEALVLLIQDRGIGIPSADQARLFTSFSRASNVGDRPGTGLGLVVVQRCVALHGGTLAMNSEEGQGTTVTVRLPMFSDSTSRS